MKKTRLLLILLLGLALTLCLFACDGQKTPPECTHEDKDEDGVCDLCKAELEEPEPQGIKLIENGEFLFRIVLGSDVTSAMRMAVDDFAEAMEEFGIELTVSSDTDDGEDWELEVLIGTVKSRGKKYEYYKYDLGHEGYAVTPFDDTKIAVVGGSDEALDEAFRIFTEDILGINEDTEYIDDVSISDDEWIEEKTDGYRIDSISIGGEDIKGFFIIREAGNSIISDIATNLQSTLYKKAGYRLEMKDTDEDIEKAIYIRLTSDAGRDGFRVRCEGGSLFIECAHKNVFADSVSKFMQATFKTGDIKFDTGYSYTLPVSVVYYEDFGAVGNGRTDDFEAIKAAHDFANEGGQTVKAKNGSRYYIGAHDTTVTIKTDTDWTGATIIIDDTRVTPGSKASGTNVFTVSSDYKYTCYNETLENLDEMPFSSLKAGAESVGWAPGFPAALRVMTTYRKNHIRYGYKSEGGNQQEIILVDKDGNIDKSTPVMFDYEIVNYVEVYHADETPITLSGGSFISRVYNPKSDSDWSYYARGINVKRANTTVKGLTHTLEGEDQINGAVPYGGFLGAQFTTNVLFEDCTLQGHRSGKEGSYDTGAFLANNVTWRRCIQSNYAYNEATGEFQDSALGEGGVIVAVPVTNDDGVWGRGLWGIMGTNVCKNLSYESCRLSRFDAHESSYNASIKDSHVTLINVTGAGEFIIEDSVITSFPESRSTNVITIRDDYGSMWRGSITIKNVRVSNNPQKMTLLGTIWRNHYYGYKTAMPEILTVDGISFDNKCEVNIFTASLEKREDCCGDFSKDTISCSQTDQNRDGRCDNCYTSTCTTHVKGDGVFCKVCGIIMCKDDCKDANGNGRCDGCGALLNSSSAKKFENLNPYAPPKKISISNASKSVSFVLVDIEFFDGTEIVGTVKRSK